MPTELHFTAEPNPHPAAATIGTVAVAVVDAEGDVVTTDSSTVTLSLGGGGGAIGGTLTQQAVNGVATFADLNVATPGTFYLAATDGTLASARSDTFTVSLDPPTHLILSGLPARLAEGQTLSSGTLTLADASGKTVTAVPSDLVALTLTKPDGTTATESAYDTSISLLGALSQFTLTTAGTNTITAVIQGLAPASATFTVTASKATYIKFDPVVGSVPFGSAPPAATFAVADIYGNVVHDDDGQTVSVTAGPYGVYTETCRATAVIVDGYGHVDPADFTGTLDKSGLWTIGADIGNGISGASDRFTVEPPLAATLSVAAPWGTLLPGENVGPVAVRLYAADGELSTADTSVVALSLESAGGGPALWTGTATAANGIATFNSVLIPAAGSYVLSASDGSLPVSTTTAFSTAKKADNTVTVVGRALAPIVFDTDRSKRLIGPVLNHMWAEFINTDTNTFVSRHKVAVSGNKVVVSGVVLHQPGHYEVDLGNPYVGLQTHDFTVVAAPAARLKFTAVPATLATPATITVTAVDAFGNVTPLSDGLTVHLRLSAATVAGIRPVLAAPTTATLMGGTATFTGVAVTGGKHGTHDKLTALAGKLAATSTPFAIG